MLKVTPAKNVPGVEDEGQKMLLLKQLADLEELLRLQSELSSCEFSFESLSGSWMAAA